MPTEALRGEPLKDRLRALVSELMLIPGLSGYEGRVRQRLARELEDLGIAARSDRLGNLIATIAGDSTAPSVMVFPIWTNWASLCARLRATALCVWSA